MIKRRRFRSAHFCARSTPASIVFPSPTSSARIAPLERTIEGEQGSFHLVRVEIDLSVGQRRRECFDAVGPGPKGELVARYFAW